MNRSSLRVISSGNPLSFTSFGSEDRSTWGNGLAGHSIVSSERFFDLDRKQSFYDCTNHDSKQYDFDGRIWSPRSTMSMLSAEKAPFYVPLRMRRPSAPVRLSKVIVDSFTNLLFGDGRFPKFRCDADPDTEDFGNALAEVGELEKKMIRARNLGGAMGSVGLSWSFRDGKPRFDVHNAKNLYVHSWADRERLLPRHVVEVFLYADIAWDGKQFTKQWWWHRRDWTPNAEIAFKPVPFEEKKDPYWIPDLTRSYLHNDGVPHFEWIQNLPSEDIDGLPDYEGLYDTFEALDTMMSVIVRGGTLNLDPTLLLKMDQEQVNRMGVRKGSDNALTVGKDGDASYMELNGAGLTAGMEIVKELRRFALETAQCVVPDPNEVAAQGISSVALKALFAPMIGKTNILRSQYGAPMKRTLEIMTEVARSALEMPIYEEDPETGEKTAVQVVLDLPPRVEKESPPPPKPKAPPGPSDKLVPHPNDPSLPPVPAPEDEQDDDEPKEDDDTDESSASGEKPVDPNKPPEDKIKLVERTPGKGEQYDVKWGNYFQPTPDDLSKMATVFQVTTGGKAFQSNQTAAEEMAQLMGRDPNEEWKRVQMAGKQDQQNEQDMMAHAGAAAAGMHPGGPPKPFGGPPKPFGGGPPKPFGGPPKPPGKPFGG